MRGVITAVCALTFIASAHGQPPPLILMDGHVHITDRVYWEGIDPWTPQPLGPWDFARAHAAGVNVVIENIAPYGFEPYDGTVRQTLRLLETLRKLADRHRDKMAIALSSHEVHNIVASGRVAVIIGN
jgi:membrane dipeptidase